MSHKKENIFSTKTTLGLGHLYDSNVERTAYHIQLFRKLYNLPTYCKEERVTPELFAYCMQRDYFSNIIAFQSRKVFLARTMGLRLGWSLPGGTIRSKEDELLQDAIYRIISRDIPNIEIGELKPIAYLEKIYRLDDQTVTHHGITFAARVRNPSPEEIARNEDIKGRFISIDDAREIKRICPFDADLFTLGRHHIEEQQHIDHDAIDEEIRTFDTITKLARWIHAYLIGPVGRTFSSRILKREILRYINRTDFFLDIACGDDKFIWEVAEKAELCVANDIQWKLIKKLISSQKNQTQKVIFVNHDACALPFEKRFDFVLCKNMLHHMGTKTQLIELLSSLQKVSKRLLIVDPEDPSTSWLGKLWNKYYVRFLKERGNKFFSRKFLENTIKEFYTEASNIELKTVYTIKGQYMFCYITFNDNSSTEPSLLTKDGLGKFTVGEIMHNRKAVIFDFDGLLFDTERLFLNAIRSVLSLKGISIKDIDYINKDLQNGTSLLENLHESGTLDNPESVMSEIYDEYERLLDHGVFEMPGAKAAINALFGKYRLAIASSSRRVFINKILREHGLYDKFEIIISRENTNHLKPDPDCFRQILRELNLRADDCVVVEDSIRGLKAAKSIGMRCIVVPNEMTRGASFGGADLIIDSLEEILITPV